MRIDLPCCDFKNCKYNFDCNCMNLKMYARCDYIYLKNHIEVITAGQEIIPSHITKEAD